MPAEAATRAYFDTSVLVKCFVREPGTEKAMRLVGRHGVVSSMLAPIELVGALRRQEASGGLTRLQREAARLRLRVERPGWMLLAIDPHVLARAETLVATEAVKTLDKQLKELESQIKVKKNEED